MSRLHTPPPEDYDASLVSALITASGNNTPVETFSQLFTQCRATAPPSTSMLPLQPAIYAACEHGHVSTASYLLAQGLVIDELAVHAAIRSGSTDIFDTLLAAGWDINRPRGNFKPPALQSVLHDEVLIEWFLAHGADPMAASLSGHTPLVSAAYAAPLAILERLVTAVCEKDPFSEVLPPCNVLHAAAKSPIEGRVTIMEFLLRKGANINAIENAYDERLFRWFKHRGLGTALHVAADRGNKEIVEFLLARGADRGILDSLGRTAEEIAERRNHKDEVAMLKKNDSLEI
jgi:ankyrin repeat protein